jgi:hypothetical protein
MRAARGRPGTGSGAPEGHAGADSIDDIALPRHGGMRRLLTRIQAPFTLGTSRGHSPWARAARWSVGYRRRNPAAQPSGLSLTLNSSPIIPARFEVRCPRTPRPSGYGTFQTSCWMHWRNCPTATGAGSRSDQTATSSCTTGRAPATPRQSTSRRYRPHGLPAVGRSHALPTTLGSAPTLRRPSARDASIQGTRRRGRRLDQLAPVPSSPRGSPHMFQRGRGRVGNAVWTSNSGSRVAAPR